MISLFPMDSHLLIVVDHIK